MIYLRIDPVSGVPLGLQIERQLCLAIATGRLAAGERLPSARDLAASLGVNFHTVRKAYSGLEREGVLVTSRGRGTFVADSETELSEAEIRRHVRRHLARLAEDFAGADVSGEELERIVAEELSLLLRKKGN